MNFAKFSDALNRTGGTMTGPLTSQQITPSASNTYDLGSSSFFFRSGYLKTSIVLGQTAGNYTLTWANPAAARAISIEDPGGTDIFVWKAATQTLTNKTLTAPTLSGTVTGTYTLGGTPTVASPTVTGSISCTGCVSSTNISDGTIVNADLAGSIAASKLVGTDIATVGTVTSGTWSASFGAVSGANLTNLTAGNLSGTIASAVQDNITRLGTIASGVWNGTRLTSSYVPATTAYTDASNTFSVAQTINTGATGAVTGLTITGTGASSAGLSVNMGSAANYLLYTADTGVQRFSVATNGQTNFMGGATYVDTNADLRPLTDGTKHVGVPSARFAYMTALAYNTTDVSLDNNWSLTESYRIGIQEPGIGVLDETGHLVAFFGKDRTYLKQPVLDVDDLSYEVTTLDQRIHMDPTPELRVKGHDGNGNPIFKTKADVAPMPDPKKTKSNRQRGGK